MKKIFLSFVFVFSFSLIVFSQNKFEGYNIILQVPTTQKATACAVRYSPPTGNVTISDLNAATPLNVRSCDGSGTTVSRSGANAVMRANSANYKWCFEGEDKRYRVTIAGDQFAPAMTYDWIATPDERTLGFYNIRDFGAVGNGQADDTIAIQSAMAFMAAHNGGMLTFPEGEYIVTAPVVLPPGVVIQGVNGLNTGAATNNIVQKNTSRITLKGANRAMFLIGECVEKVVIKDIELYAQSSDKTYGIEGVGAYQSSQDFYFERVAFTNFNRGIYVHGLDATAQHWQFDYIKVNHCRFIYNTDVGILVNTRNSDWRIEGSLFINPPRTPTQKGDSMRFEHAALIGIYDTFGGGFSTARGGTFIDVIDNANLTIVGSQTESMTNSIVYNSTNNPYAGDLSYPITIVNSIFGDPIIFNARRVLVSTGNLYGPKTFKADERLLVYSTGDRFCYDGYTLGCEGGTSNNFDKARIMFMTGQPDEGSVKGRPTVFGTDVLFNNPVQMPTFAQNALPAGKANGSMVYCSNCKRSTTPCQAGGTGAPAMVVNNQWSCL